MSDEHVYACGALNHPGNSVCTPDPIVTVIKGVVHCQQIGQVRTTVHIRIGRRLDLRIQLSLEDERRFVMGQPVIAVIPAEAVRLQASLFRRSRQRWNRWYGRIVLVASHHAGLTLTAKVHGEGLSLMSTMHVLGAAQPLRAWDPVNIVVNPGAVELVPDWEPVPLKPITRDNPGRSINGGGALMGNVSSLFTTKEFL